MRRDRGILDEAEQMTAQAVEHYEISRYGTLKTCSDTRWTDALRLETGTVAELAS